MGRLLAELGALIDDPAVDISRIPPNRPSGPPSPLDSELLRALERAQRLLWPDAPTIPMMLMAATDMAQLRARGVKAYGIGKLLAVLDGPADVVALL